MNRSKFLLDQMLDAQVAAALLERGWDVVRVSELGLARADDSEILDAAIQQGRTLITLDEHFGDWAVLPLESHPGVIRLKVNPATSTTVMESLVPFLRQHAERSFENHLVIVKQLAARWIRTSS